jgi:3'-phosphoadenosine 5'-phosphosulfate sulfotransferase (PAPS reductase)/FAD synthetase
MTREDLKEMQSWSLQRKIQVTQLRIMEWYEHYGGNVYVSFSGGKDSTVLLDLSRRIYPDIEAVFVDTGLEYPEIRQFVNTKQNITTLRPKMSFVEVLKKYGYPVIGKETAQAIYEARHKPDGAQALKFESGSEHNQKYGAKYDLSKYKYLLDSDIPISHMCCKVIKKKPFYDYEKKVGKLPLLGTMAEESMLRESEWMKNGCNAFDGKRPKSTPMAFWTEQDVLTYIKQTKILYCSVYGDIVASYEGCDYDSTFFDNRLRCTGCQRTGCMFCMFGVHLEKEPNRFQQMKITHPKQYDYCINQLGLGKVLDCINVKY